MSWFSETKDAKQYKTEQDAALAWNFLSGQAKWKLLDKD